MNRKKGYLLILLAALTYSTTEVALKGLAGAFAPMQVTVERVLIGGLFLLPLGVRELRQRGVTLTRSDWRYFAFLGFLTVVLHMSLLQMALLTEDASAVAIIYSGNPVFALIFAHWILKEPFRRNHIIALILEVVGILFILNPRELEMSVGGFLKILCATILFACYGTLGKLRLERLGSMPITALNLTVGGVEMLAIVLLGKLDAVAALYERVGLGIFAHVPLTAGFTPKTAALLLYVGIVVAGIGFWLMTKITEYTSATEASFIYLLKPIIATCFAVAIFHETITTNRIVGIAFFTASSLCVMVPLLRELWHEKKLAK